MRDNEYYLVAALAVASYDYNSKMKITLVGTPNGSKGLFYDFYMSALKGESDFNLIDVYFFQCSLFKNKEKLREMRMNMGEKSFAQEIMGLFLP